MSRIKTPLWVYFIYSDRKEISDCQGLWSEWNKEWLIMGRGCLFGVMKMFWNWMMVMVAQSGEYTKNHCIIQVKEWILWYVNYSSMKNCPCPPPPHPALAKCVLVYSTHYESMSPGEGLLMKRSSLTTILNKWKGGLAKRKALQELLMDHLFLEDTWRGADHVPGTILGAGGNKMKKSECPSQHPQINLE